MYADKLLAMEVFDTMFSGSTTKGENFKMSSD